MRKLCAFGVRRGKTAARDVGDGGACGKGDRSVDVGSLERGKIAEDDGEGIAVSKAGDDGAKRDAGAAENALACDDLWIACEVLHVVHDEKYSAR